MTLACQASHRNPIRATEGATQSERERKLIGMSTRVGQPRIKGNTTYYRLVTDEDETPVRLHDDIAEIIDRLGPEECAVGKVEVRYINARGEEKRAEIKFDSDGTHRDVYRTWQYSQQSGREIPLWFFNVKYRGNKFRIKLDVPNQRMAIAVSARDEDTSLFDEFMHSLEGKNDWSHRQPPRRQAARRQDDYDDGYIGYDEDYEEDRLDESAMANLVDDGYGQGPDGRYDDGYGQGGYDQGYDDRYDQRGHNRQGYDDRYDQDGYGRGYDDGYDRGGYDQGYDDRYDQGYDDRYDQGGYDDGYGRGGYDQDQGGAQGYPTANQPQGPVPQPGQQGQRQAGGVSGDPFSKYFSLAMAEVIFTSVAGLALIILLNMETHLGVSITSVIFCSILLVAPLLSVSALTRVTAAHKTIEEDYLRGIRSYEKAKKRMIAVLVLVIIWIVVLCYLGFLWYTHGLPPQLSGIYDLLDHSI